MKKKIYIEPKTKVSSDTLSSIIVTSGGAGAAYGGGGDGSSHSQDQTVNPDTGGDLVPCAKNRFYEDDDANW